MHTFRSVNEALPILAHLLLTEGADVPSRAGATKELAFQHFSLTHPLHREIVVPGRKANIAAQIAETMWVLAGRNDVEWLSAYLPRAADFSDDGATWRAGYGPRLRGWKTYELDGPEHVDQMQEIITLLRNDPTTRRAAMSIWDPASDYTDSKDIPCNDWLHFLARGGVLNLHVAIRSNDLVWGWSGINQFEWSVLLEVVAAYTGLKVGRIFYAVSSLHMYDRHWDKAPTWKNTTVHTQRDRRFEPEGLDWDLLCAKWFKVEQGIREGASKHRLDIEIAAFPEPMLRSWLRVIAWWWTGDEAYLTLVWDTRLRHAAQVGTGPRKALSVAVSAPQGLAHRFIEEVTALHTEKDAAYGTSWKKRGELFSILPNIARKADRLGAGDTTDENQTDTAVDLMVYLAKYRMYLADQKVVQHLSDTPEAANRLIFRVVNDVVSAEQPWTTVELEDELKAGVEEMMASAEARDPDRHYAVDHLLGRAAVLAMRRWGETPALFAQSESYRGADHD